MSLRIALLASPLLGPAAWDPVRVELERAGWDPVVATHSGPAPSSARDVTAAFVQALTRSDEWVLVPHSNASLAAPPLARQRRVRAVVYVDARLPMPGRRPMLSEAALQSRARLADGDGLLPPWSEWWDEDMAKLYPSVESRRECEAEMRRLPLDYFGGEVDGSGWDLLPSAYLAFGETYAADRERAAREGLVTATIDEADHLHMLIDPATVARRLQDLLDALGVRHDQGL